MDGDLQNMPVLSLSTPYYLLTVKEIKLNKKFVIAWLRGNQLKQRWKHSHEPLHVGTFDYVTNAIF